MKSAFEIIHQNQTWISCVIAITLSIVTAIITGFLQREINPAENFVKYSAYKIGYQDAVLKSSVKKIDEIATNVYLDSLDRIIVTLRISCGLAFLASFLHFSSSAWALFKRSPMSTSVWLVGNFVTLISLIAAVSLPLTYPLKGPLILNLFYAIICVDAFLTLLLLVAVYLDQRSLPSVTDVENDSSPETTTEPSEKPNQTVEDAPATATTTGVISTPNATEEEELPTPPPPPAASTAGEANDGN